MNFFFVTFYVFLLLIYRNICCSRFDYDIILFSQRWYETDCLKWRNQNSENECSLNLVEKEARSWLVHGIWPTKLHSKASTPIDCNTQPYNQSELIPIQNQLNDYWPDTHTTKKKKKKSKRNQFWYHEWSKHGSCLLNEPHFKSQLDYFAQGLSWLKSYNMYNILAGSDIKPSLDVGYNSNDIEKAIRNRIHAKPILKCYLNSNLKKNIMFEIRLCFDKNLTLIDCNGIGEIHEREVIDCKPNSTVYYYSPNSAWSIATNSYLTLVMLLLFGNFIVTSTCLKN